MSISDWSSDVCSSDLVELERSVGAQLRAGAADAAVGLRVAHVFQRVHRRHAEVALRSAGKPELGTQLAPDQRQHRVVFGLRQVAHAHQGRVDAAAGGTHRHDRLLAAPAPGDHHDLAAERSEEHTSELQSLMRISYAVFCLKKKKIKNM